MNTAITNPVIQRNIETIRAWLDAHDRQDMKALDFYTEDIEIVEMPTGVVYKGMDKMRELARMAYRRKGWKELTNIIATETQACVEYIAKADMSQPLTKERRKKAVSMESMYRKPNQAARPSRSQSATSVNLPKKAKSTACANIGMLRP